MKIQKMGSGKLSGLSVKDVAIFVFTPVLFSREVSDTTLQREVDVDEVVITSSRTAETFSRALRLLEVCTSGDVRQSVTGEPAYALEAVTGASLTGIAG